MMDKSAPAERQQDDPAAPEARAGADIIYLPDERQRTKKVTSGSEKRQRTTAVRVRLHPADAYRLKAEAAAAQMSLAGYLATGRLDKEASPRPRQRGRGSVDVAKLTAALVAFNRVGNNQNQEMRALNELVLIAREQSNARLEDLVAQRIEALRRMPDLFAEPVAAILGALNRDREG